MRALHVLRYGRKRQTHRRRPLAPGPWRHERVGRARVGQPMRRRPRWHGVSALRSRCHGPEGRLRRSRGRSLRRHPRGHRNGARAFGVRHWNRVRSGAGRRARRGGSRPAPRVHCPRQHRERQRGFGRRARRPRINARLRRECRPATRTAPHMRSVARVGQLGVGWCGAVRDRRHVVPRRGGAHRVWIILGWGRIHLPLGFGQHDHRAPKGALLALELGAAGARRRPLVLLAHNPHALPEARGLLADHSAHVHGRAASSAFLVLRRLQALSVPKGAGGGHRGGKSTTFCAS